MADKEQKLGPNVTYNPPEGEPETTEVGGVPMVKGESVNVVDLLGETRAGALLAKLANNSFFKVDGAPDHAKQAEAREKQQKKVDEAKAKAEERQREEREQAARGETRTNQLGKPATGKKGETPETSAETADLPRTPRG
jgi:sRNA-binding protein